MSQRTIALAPDEILIDGSKHTLVPGYQEWSTIRNSIHPCFLDLYYKQTYITTLREYAGGKGYAERYCREKQYADLASAVEASKNNFGVSWTDQKNERQGIVQWCQHGPTVATVTVALSGEEMDLLETTAAANGYDVETLATRAVKALFYDGCLPF